MKASIGVLVHPSASLLSRPYKILEQDFVCGYAGNAMSHRITKRRAERDRELAHNEVRAIITQAMVVAGTTPAAIYAYFKTDVILTMEKEDRIPLQRLRAWNAAIESGLILKDIMKTYTPAITKAITMKTPVPRGENFSSTKSVQVENSKCDFQ